MREQALFVGDHLVEDGERFDGGGLAGHEAIAFGFLMGLRLRERGRSRRGGDQIREGGVAGLDQSLEAIEAGLLRGVVDG